jgi:hypothetical protein
MNCSSFERWLDAGMPEEGLRRALAHAEGCKVCAPTLVEARAVEAALRGDAKRPVVGAPTEGPASAPTFASAGFVDAVMAQVGMDGVRMRPTDVAVSPEAPTALWLRLFADPVTVVSATLAIVVGVVAVIEPGWFAAGAAALLAHGERAGEALATWPLLSQPSRAAAAAALAIAPLLTLLAFVAYRALERAVILTAGSRRR